jgi:hypothetical protein
MKTKPSSHGASPAPIGLWVGRPLAHPIPAERVLLKRAPYEHRRLRVEPHRLVDDACGEPQLADVRHARLAVADDLVRLVVQSRVGSGFRVFFPLFKV